MIERNIEFFTLLLKYGVVGGLNTVFTFALYFLLLKILGIQYLIALSAAWISGIIATYVVNFLWVFKPEEKLVFQRRLSKYFAVHSVSYLMNFGLLGVICETTGQDPFLIQIGLAPIVVVVNFCGIKYWSLKPSTKLQQD